MMPMRHDLAHRIQISLISHVGHAYHGVCLFVANVLSHVGHGHTPWGF